MSDPASIPDDPSILDEDLLWRRIAQEHWVKDPKVEGGYRISSAAFENSSDGSGMSVTNGTEALRNGRSTSTIFESYSIAKCLLIAEFTAGLARNLSQGITRSSTPEDPEHSNVNGKKTRGVKNRLRKGSREIHRSSVSN